MSVDVNVSRMCRMGGSRWDEVEGRKKSRNTREGRNAYLVHPLFRRGLCRVDPGVRHLLRLFLVLRHLIDDLLDVLLRPLDAHTVPHDHHVLVDRLGVGHVHSDLEVGLDVFDLTPSGTNDVVEER